MSDEAQPTIDGLYAQIVALRADLDDFAVRAVRYDADKTIRFHDDGRVSELQSRARRLHADAYQLSPAAQKVAAILGG